MRLANDARDVNPACLDVDDEQDVLANETSERKYLDVEEVHCCYGAQMGLDDVFHGIRLPRSGAGEGHGL